MGADSAGRGVVVVAPDIPDSAPAVVREGLVRRRLVAVTGRCPCGATLTVPELRPGTVTTVEVLHEAASPAADPQVDAWRAS